MPRQLSTQSLIKNLSNERILYYINRDREEKRNPEKHTKYVTVRQFFGNSGVKHLKQELEKRKKKGRISKVAGIKRKTTSRKLGEIPTFEQLMRY